MIRSIADDTIQIITSLFNLPPNVVDIDTSMENLEQWDSLQHINVIMDIEQHFGISLAPEEIVKLHSVKLITEMVQSKIKLKGNDEGILC
jgi:acyl carrier protein